MLRRLEKRILVDLPSLEAREAMLKQYLPPVIHSVEGSVEIKSQIDYGELAKVHACPFMQTLKASSYNTLQKVSLGFVSIDIRLRDLSNAL